MRIPLRYQISEYDCGPTTVLNGISCLFDSEAISPILIRHVSMYSLDNSDSEGRIGKHGTSRAAMKFISSWLDTYGEMGQLPVSTEYLSGEDVFFGQGGRLEDGIRKGGVAVLRLMFDVWHYVLVTGIEDDKILIFDPYYHPEKFDQAPDIELIADRPFQCNRKVPRKYFDCEGDTIYALGPKPEREAVLIFNTEK